MRRMGVIKGGLATVLTVLLLGSMVEVGARAPRERRLSPLRASTPLDYSAPPAGGFAPLTEDYVRRIVGDGTHILGRFGSPSAPPDGAQKDRSSHRLGPLVIDHALTNDGMENAFTVPRIPFTARTNSQGATRNDAEDPTTCAGFGQTIWYRYRPSANEAIIVRAHASAAVAVAAFTRTTSPTPEQLACGSDTEGRARIVLPVIAGTTYLFQITVQVPGNVSFSIDPARRTFAASIRSDGSFVGRYSYAPRISGNGRFVVFQSPGYLTHHEISTPQVYLRDLLTGSTELLSLTQDGTEPNASSNNPNISHDGRYVVWDSTATNVVPEDTTPDIDVFLRDRLRGTTELVSLSSDARNAEGDGAQISANGRYVTFRSGHETGFRYRLGYVRDRLLGRTIRGTRTAAGGMPNGESGIGAISADGRYLMFASFADNVAPGVTPPTQGAMNGSGVFTEFLYVHDLKTGRVAPECVNEEGVHADARCYSAALSENGRYSVFWSAATNLIPGLPSAPPGNHFAMYCYVRDRVTGKLEILNIDGGGNPVPELWKRQLPGGVQGDEWSLRNSISADGRFVGFEGYAQLLGGDPPRTLDTFVRDRKARVTLLVSEAPDGSPARPGPRGGTPDSNGVPEGSMWSYLSADGSVVAFQSSATNLVPADENNAMDIFVRFLGDR